MWVFQEELFGIDIIVFAVDVRTLMLGDFAAYLVAIFAKNLAAVASVQADCESATLIVAVKPVLGTTATEMATTLMHCVAVVAALKTLVVATRVQNGGLFGYLCCQNQFQTAVVVTRVHHFPKVVDVYLLDYFADLLTVVATLVFVAVALN